MAASPRLKVYYPDGEYEGCAKSYESAAAMVGLMRGGATVRLGHAKSRTLWTEVEDGFAGDSYDHAAQTMSDREDAILERFTDKDKQCGKYYPAECHTLHLPPRENY